MTWKNCVYVKKIILDIHEDEELGSPIEEEEESTESVYGWIISERAAIKNNGSKRKMKKQDVESKGKR